MQLISKVQDTAYMLQNFAFQPVLQQLNQKIVLKLNYRRQVFHFALNFLPWEFLLIKKLDFEKNKIIQYTTFKTDMIKVFLVFSISNFFTNKNSQGRKLSVVQLQFYQYTANQNIKYFLLVATHTVCNLTSEKRPRFFTLGVH